MPSSLAMALPAETPRRVRRTVVADSVLGMLVFIAAELMFFGALICARFIVSARVPGGWPPPDQPRLPLLTTGLNSLLLFASAWFLYRSNRAFAASASHRQTRRLLWIAMALGAGFVAFQGVEWVRLLGYGLTMQSGPFGSFFYLLIGTHALHVVGALAFLGHVQWTFGRGELRPPRFWAAQIFWYFVVALWPVLYVTVYLL